MPSRFEIKPLPSQAKEFHLVSTAVHHLERSLGRVPEATATFSGGRCSGDIHATILGICSIAPESGKSAVFQPGTTLPL